MQAKHKHGSLFCFHGSSMENWYSILRNGLRNLSNSGLMTAGAAYGAGIYASENYGTSYGYTAKYAQGQKTWKNCIDNIKNSFVIGIVEIINKQQYQKSGKNIMVVPEEDDIIIRYLLVLKNNGYPAGALVSTNVGFDKHYSAQLKRINQELAQNRQLRIDEAYAQFKERKIRQKEAQRKIEQESVERVRKADEELLEKQFKEMAKRLTGKGSALASQRINKDYIGLMGSGEFKNIAECEFYKDNMYVWRLSFNLFKYEVSKNLKVDFESLAKRMGKPV